MRIRRTALVAASIVAVSASVLALPLSGASASDRGHGDGGQDQSSHGEQHGQSDRHDGYSIGLWGDMPYGATGLAQLPALIADINKQELEFTVFDGDIKNGSSRCDQLQYDQARSTFSQIVWATVYTPGDNEWTDCDRTNNGAYDPNERLALIRSTFFADSESQGQDRMDVTRQSAAFPENARWDHDGVTFITINVPGTDNNYPVTDAGGNALDADKKLVSVTGRPQNGDLAEYTARNAANLAWLEAGFRFAKTHGSKGVMIVQQADMWAPTDPTAHYADEKAKLAQLTAGFGRPVVLVNGDTHEYVVDQPLTDAAGAVVPNFTRVTTFGELRNHWVKADIAPNTPQVFTFTPMLVPGNTP